VHYGRLKPGEPARRDGFTAPVHCRHHTGYHLNRGRSLAKRWPDLNFPWGKDRLHYQVVREQPGGVPALAGAPCLQFFSSLCGVMRNRVLIRYVFLRQNIKRIQRKCLPANFYLINKRDALMTDNDRFSPKGNLFTSMNYNYKK